MNKFWKILATIGIIIVLIIVALDLNAGKHPSKINYGVTFSYPYAKSLGLDWKPVYSAMFTDLHIKLLRIPAYWDEVERNKDTYTFDDLDFEVKQAEQNNASIILAVGKRLPRWPECHEPDWASKLAIADEQNALLSYIEKTVQRYQGSPAITTWQVENEAFVSSFGPCPKLDVAFFDKEIALVKKLDPGRPILITDSGELSSWLPAGSRGDEFGTTFYRYVYSDVLKRYWTNFYFPTWFYRAKAGLVRVFNPKPIMLAELETEAWTTKGITSTPIDEQFKTMSLDHFHTITKLAAETGFNPQYLWGVEWWYWMKQQGHPEFLEAAKDLVNQ